MPWHTKTEGNEVVVVRDSDGKVVGRHQSRDKALAHLRALYASEVVKSKFVDETAQARHEGFIDFLKASFGGDRSAAGRYAAQQRWKGHVKDQPQDPFDRIKAESLRVAGLLKQMEQAVGGSGKAPTVSMMTGTWGTVWADQNLADLYESWDEREGYSLKSTRLPVQKRESGELKTGKTWDGKEYIEIQEINMPSPAVFEIEQQVNALGREVLSIAEASLNAEGITSEGIEQYEASRQKRIDEATSKLQEVSNLLNWENRDKPNTTGVPFSKELQDLIIKRNALAEEITSLSSTPNDPEYKKKKIEFGKNQDQLMNAMREWEPFRDAADEHDKATRIPKAIPYQAQVYAKVAGMLRQVREFGTEPISAVAVSDKHDWIATRFRNSVQDRFPSDIIKKVNSNMGTIQVSESGGGGSWNYSTKTVRTDPLNDYVDMHEFIHAWSDSSTQVRYVEAALLARRIVGLRSEIGKTPMSSKKMAQGIQPIYQQKTYTSKSGMKYALKFPHVRDDFNDPYAGRLYSTGGAEVLTVGHDYAYTSHRMRTVSKKPFDTDLSATIIGLLFTAERP